jgi:hypothetical protein
MIPREILRLAISFPSVRQRASDGAGAERRESAYLGGRVAIRFARCEFKRF